MMHEDNTGEQMKGDSDNIYTVGDNVDDVEEQRFIESEAAALALAASSQNIDNSDSNVQILDNSLAAEDYHTGPISSAVTISDNDETLTATIKSMLQESFHITDQPQSASSASPPDIATCGVAQHNTEVANTTASNITSLESTTNNESTALAGTEFYNKGLAMWEMNRRKWLQKSKPTNTCEEQIVNKDRLTQQQSISITDENVEERNHAKPINVDEIIDAIFSSHKKLLLNNGCSDTFPQSVPLPQLVDILQDLWEAESL